MTFRCSITGISTMFMTASHQSSQHAAARADHLLSHLLCLIPRSLLRDICVFSDCSFHKLSAESRADRLEKNTLSASTIHLSECLTISDQGQSPGHPCPRGRRHGARPSAEREFKIWSPCLIKPLPQGLLARVDEFDCRGMSNVQFCGSIAVELVLPIFARKPHAKLRSRRRILHRLGLDILRLLAVVSTPG